MKYRLFVCALSSVFSASLFCDNFFIFPSRKKKIEIVKRIQQLSRVKTKKGDQTTFSRRRTRNH